MLPRAAVKSPAPPTVRESAQPIRKEEAMSQTAITQDDIDAVRKSLTPKK